MQIRIELSPLVEKVLARRAEREGKTMEAVACELIDKELARQKALEEWDCRPFVVQAAK